MWRFWGRIDMHRYIALVGEPEGKRHLEDLGIDGSIVLRMDLKVKGWEGPDR
jgi:hypothetical protein